MTVAAKFVGTEEQNKNYTVSSRKWVAKGTDVFVKEFTLGKDEEVPWHKHTNVFDIFYCIEGQLIIEHLGKNGGTKPDVITLNVGDSAKIDVGFPHRPFNAGPGVCRFLIIQGVGEYDFLPFKQD
jgi:mannose-6-phosphate isomerase-like protein (cupin superfamily)